MKVFDGHNDALLRISTGGVRPFMDGDDGAHIDLARALAPESRFGGGLFAIWVPSAVEAPRIPTDSIDPETGQRRSTAAAVECAVAQDFVRARIRDLKSIEREVERFRIATQPTEVRASLERQNEVVAMIHIEGAEAVDLELTALDEFNREGVRSLGPVWSRPNAFGFGVPFGSSAGPDIGPGLTDAGKRLVERCRQLGWLVDLSHLNLRGFWDVAEIYGPLVATHSAVHTICPTTRNLLDDQLKAIHESGGVVGLNFHFRDLVAGANEATEVTVDRIVEHAQYIAERWGTDMIAFGSDFDGADPPADLPDIASLGRLESAFVRGGFTEAEYAKFAQKNWLRILERVYSRRTVSS